ncbi:protein ORD [Drosophila teissieri]|uniref:protein ORD n=1 Tax=Drosophila teissieri TaxID=7243 RepID=UPI001CB9F225|nr:protein ORD [Drosophila teissieri]
MDLSKHLPTLQNAKKFSSETNDCKLLLEMCGDNTLNKNHTIKFITLKINNCLGCDGVEINFSKADNVHMIIYSLLQDLPKDLAAVTPVAQAILLLCSLTYPDAESLETIPQLEIGKGSVAMSFEMHPMAKDKATAQAQEPESDLDDGPSTSRQAMERLEQRAERKAKEATTRNLHAQVTHVTVERRFDVYSLDTVSYQIDGGKRQTCRLPEFHAKFFVRPQHSINLLRQLHEKCSGNWLKVIQSDGEGDAFRKFRDPDSPFETFVKLFDSKPMPPNDVISKLVKTCLHIDEAVRLSEREFILEVFNQVRHIFEYITAQEYTVWFLVPCLGDDDEQRSPTLEDFDLTKVRTSIRPAGDNSNIWWDHTDHNIKDILLVAFQLDLATHVNQSVLVISHLETLAEFSTMQYVTAFFMNDFYAKKDSDPKWICHRYLERIVDVALFLGVIVIIEYPSAFTLLQEGRHLIKCFQKENRQSSGAMQWEIFEDVVKESESDLEFLKEAVGQDQPNM